MNKKESVFNERDLIPSQVFEIMAQVDSLPSLVEKIAWLIEHGNQHNFSTLPFGKPTHIIFVHGYIAYNWTWMACFKIQERKSEYYIEFTKSSNTLRKINFSEKYQRDLSLEQIKDILSLDKKIGNQLGMD